MKHTYRISWTQHPESCGITITQKIKVVLIFFVIFQKISIFYLYAHKLTILRWTQGTIVIFCYLDYLQTMRFLFICLEYRHLFVFVGLHLLFLDSIDKNMVDVPWIANMPYNLIGILETKWYFEAGPVVIYCLLFLVPATSEGNFLRRSRIVEAGRWCDQYADEEKILVIEHLWISICPPTN